MSLLIQKQKVDRRWIHHNSRFQNVERHRPPRFQRLPIYQIRIQMPRLEHQRGCSNHCPNAVVEIR